MIKCLECNKELKRIQWTHFKKCKGSIKSLTEYKIKYPNAILVDEETAKISSVTKSGLLKKYGEEEGNKRWESYRNKQSISNTYEYKKNKFGMTEKEFDEYNKNRSSTKENFIKRYGEEEGNKKWYNYTTLQKYVGSSLEYFQEKFGEEEGNKRWKLINKAKGNSLEYFQENFGEEEGIIKYKKSWSNRKFKNNSILSQELFNNIFKKLNNVECYFASHNKEFGKIDVKNKKYYFYDFVIPKIKFCIEFNGDLYHANPKKYNPSDIPKFRGNKKTTLEIWEYDKIKSKILKELGFEIIIVWESDYLFNKVQMEEKLCNLIIQKLNNVQ